MQQEIKEISRNSPYYPKEWADLIDAPTCLQYVGDEKLLSLRKFTIVGSRRTPKVALKIGQEISKTLSSVFAIVTGLADGADEAVIESVLDSGGKIISILPGGFSALPKEKMPLLKRIMQTGLLLSPHPYDTPVRSFSYEYRNKLLATIGEGTLVLGADAKSGALITAKYTVQEEKPLFVLPYTPGATCSEGCNALLKKGAYLTENANDILEKFGVESVAKEPLPLSLSGEEKAILQTLRESGEEHISILSQKTAIPIFKIRAILSALEVKGVVVAVGGNKYAPV